MIMKKIFKGIVTVGLVTLLSACGKPVEIAPAHVGKIQTKNGMTDEVRLPSKFRLDKCWAYCDKLITLDVSDSRYVESFKTFMPKDDLELTYAVTMTMAIDPNKYDFIFDNVPAINVEDQLSGIRQSDVYKRYAESKIETVLPEIVAEFKISEIASDRSKVNDFIKKRLNKELESTPFVLKHVGLTQVDYPKIITEAKENAAQRREQEQQILAQRQLDLMAIQTEKEVETQKREVELLKAKTKALIAKEMMTKEYETLLKYETLNKLAESQNKVFVPTEMLDGIAVQNQIK